MTVEWNRTVNEIVWESQTAPGITWTTVVGGTGGTEIPARRLLPNTVGTPGQTVAVNAGGTAVEYVDAPSGGGSFPTNTEPTTDPPEPVAGASWRPSDSSSLLALAADNKWRGGWLADDGTDQTAETVDPDAITWVSTTAPGTFRFGAGGITMGSLGFWLLEADPRTGSGHPGAVGSVVWSSTVGSWLRKTGVGATAWEVAGGGDSHWSVNGSGGITPDDNLSLAGQKIYFNSEADPNHVMGASDTLNGPEIRGYADVGVYVGDTENEAATLVGRFHADGLEVDHGDGPAEVIAQGDGAGGGLSGTFPNPGLNASSVQSLVLAYLAAGANISLAVNGGGDLVISVTGVVADAINDGTTTVAPSQNAVFDALALKVPNTRTIAGVDLADNVTAAELRAALGIEWALLADETLASSAASWTGPTGLGSYDEIRVVVTGRTTQGSSTGAVNLRFNGNSVSGDYINGSGSSSTWLLVGSIAGSLTNTNRWGRVEAIVQNKAGTLHTVQSQYATTEANTNPPNSSHVVSAAGHFKQTAAITSLVVYPNTSTDFVAGTRFRVFGRLP